MTLLLRGPARTVSGQMDVVFEKGDPQRPRGHALVYFLTGTEPKKVYATYIIVLPVSVDFAKYVPPFLASHLGNVPAGDFSAFSLPPVPEEVGSHQELQDLAEARDDDLLFAGTLMSFDLPEMMQASADIVRDYSELWSQRTGASVASTDSAQQASGVNEVLYSLMNESDKLAELSKLVGTLRFATEGNDRQTGTEMEEEIKVLGRYLPEDYCISSLVQAVMDSSSRGAHLAQLYLDRCYKLSNGEEAGARDLKGKIEALEASL